MDKKKVCSKIFSAIGSQLDPKILAEKVPKDHTILKRKVWKKFPDSTRKVEINFVKKQNV